MFKTNLSIKTSCCQYAYINIPRNDQNIFMKIISSKQAWKVCFFLAIWIPAFLVPFKGTDSPGACIYTLYSCSTALEIPMSDFGFKTEFYILLQCTANFSWVRSYNWQPSLSFLLFSFTRTMPSIKSRNFLRLSFKTIFSYYYIIFIK